MAPYRMLQTAAIVLGALPLLLALVGAVLLSRALTRPVQQLAEAARRMKIGDYSRPVNVATGDELAELAVTFNSMQDDIARREARITHQARHDSLTGLPNRDYALETLDSAIDEAGAGTRDIAVMVLDLNGIGEIAASLGHDIADAYIRQAAEQLRMQIEPRFTLCRLESDSFLVVMPGCGAEGATDVADRLLQRLEPGIGLQNLNVSVRPGRRHRRSSAARRQLRPAALARHRGPDGQPPCAPRGRPVPRRRRGAAGAPADHPRRPAPRGAPRGAQAVLPAEDHARRRRVCGAEALVRWDHPTLGRLSPAEFIPIAEQSGNISILTRWATDRRGAGVPAAGWRRGSDMPVSVNLSAHDLLDKDLPWFVLERAAQPRPRAAYLVAEITEEGLVRDFANATVVLQRLRDLGIKISIDDFGTGYSSLAQIRNLPVDELKIDQSFVTRLPDDRADAAIVGAAIDLAHNLGLEFVAEGVETRPGAALAARARLRAGAGLLHQQAAAGRRVHQLGAQLRRRRHPARPGPQAG